MTKAVSLIKFVVKVLGHTRVVQSGSPPLYRLMLIGAITSGIVQALGGSAPKQVAENSFSWFDYIFTVGLLGSGIACLVSLYMIDGSRYCAKKLHRSLTVEFIGLIGLQTVTAVSVVANGIFNDGIPPGLGAWFQIMFWCWVWTRMWEIRKTIGELTR